MRKLTYEEKPRFTIRKTKYGYSVTFISPSSRLVYRGGGTTQLAAWYELERLLYEHRVRPTQADILRDVSRPDTGLGASDDYKATSNLPWWRRLFRI